MFLIDINLRALKTDEDTVQHIHLLQDKRIGGKTMSRTEEVNKMTENVYKVKKCLAVQLVENWLQLSAWSFIQYMTLFIFTVAHNHREFWTSSIPVWRTLSPWGNIMRRLWQVSVKHQCAWLSFVCSVFPQLSSSAGVTVAAKGYFDALVKLGELASDSQGSKELGE